MKVDEKTPSIPIILGPTASGKTQLAVALANHVNGEIISADSRQVYRQMNIGTGKDYDEYLVGGKKINYHLIDILGAGEKYDVSLFKRDCLHAIQKIRERDKTPIICGGTGLYIEALLRNFTAFDVPPNEKLRKRLLQKTTEELLEILYDISPNHQVDISTRKRVIRGIEVLTWNANRPASTIEKTTDTPAHSYQLFCLNPPVDLRREKITNRLRERMTNDGLIEEVENLLKLGLTHEQLMYYGLEYKFVTEYLLGKWTKEELFERLNTAIHRFAKRQMTFFRSMERRGAKIYWIDGALSTKEKLETVLRELKIRS